MKTQIYLVRHGQTDGNQEGRFQGRIDLPLNSLGLEQARLTALRFEKVSFAAIYSSPLSRAIRTAEAINERALKPLGYVNGLLEINLGDWEGKTERDLAIEDPQRVDCWRKRIQDFEAPAGESVREVYARGVKTVLALAARHKGQKAVLCSHGLTIRTIVCWGMALPPDSITQVGWSGNCGVNMLEWEGSPLENPPRLVIQNDSSHLPEDLRTGVNKPRITNK